jgi:hypothetical protein
VTAVSARGYARHRREAGLSGGTHRAVLKALRAGRITAGADGRIDPQVADQQWVTRSAPRVVAFVPRPAGAPASNGPGPFGSTELTAALLRERKARAYALELAVARQTRDLVPASEVDQRWSALIVAARTSLLGLPSRAKARLPHLSGADLRTLALLVSETLEELAAPRASREHGAANGRA